MKQRTCHYAKVTINPAYVKGFQPQTSQKHNIVQHIPRFTNIKYRFKNKNYVRTFNISSDNILTLNGEKHYVPLGISGIKTVSALTISVFNIKDSHSQSLEEQDIFMQQYILL